MLLDFWGLFIERISNLHLSNPSIDMIAFPLSMSEMNECIIYMQILHYNSAEL